MALHQNLPEPDARVLAFAGLAATNLGLVLVNRSLGASVFAAFTRRNAALWWVVAATAAILPASSSSPRRANFSTSARYTTTISLWHSPAA
jgi:hypothetical protein